MVETHYFCYYYSHKTNFTDPTGKQVQKKVRNLYCLDAKKRVRKGDLFHCAATHGASLSMLFFYNGINTLPNCCANAFYCYVIICYKENDILVSACVALPFT